MRANESQCRDLAQEPFFSGMTERHIKLLAENSMHAEFKPAEWILKEGGPANRFYLIREGLVALESNAKEQSAQLQTLGTGEVLGWSWLFPPYYWHFNARAITPVRSVFFYGTQLRELCEQDHDFGYELMRRISEIVIRRLHAARRAMAETADETL